jgi:hypothetical protein
VLFVLDLSTGGVSPDVFCPYFFTIAACRSSFVRSGVSTDAYHRFAVPCSALLLLWFGIVDGSGVRRSIPASLLVALLFGCLCRLTIARNTFGSGESVWNFQYSSSSVLLGHGGYSPRFSIPRVTVSDPCQMFTILSSTPITLGLMWVLGIGGGRSAHFGSLRMIAKRELGCSVLVGLVSFSRASCFSCGVKKQQERRTEQAHSNTSVQRKY